MDWMSLCHGARQSRLLACPQQKILSVAHLDNPGSPLAHWTHRTSCPAQRVVYQGFHQLIEGQLWLHQPHGVSSNRDSDTNASNKMKKKKTRKKNNRKKGGKKGGNPEMGPKIDFSHENCQEKSKQN